jgi:hypothetical protein
VQRDPEDDVGVRVGFGIAARPGADRDYFADQLGFVDGDRLRNEAAHREAEDIRQAQA